jgi:amino acid adenylation domain-containing protein
MTKRNIEAVYSLSPMQKGMLFHTALEPASGVYFEQTYCTLRGELQVELFRQAWESAIRRHAILRTCFAWKNLDKMLQVVQREVNLPFEVLDWRALPAEEQARKLEDYLQQDRRRGFDLSKAPLLRLALMRTGENSYYFVWSHHHILLDGWSLPLLLKDVLGSYQSLLSGKRADEPPVRPYRDYIRWLEKQDYESARSFWQQNLSLDQVQATLPLKRSPDSLELENRGYREIETHLAEEATAALSAFARQNGLTMSTLIQGAWYQLLHRYTGEERVICGVTVSGRPADLDGAESMLGLFINTLPLSVKIDPNLETLHWLKALQDQMAEINQYHFCPLAQIQEWCGASSRQPLFETIIVYENYPALSSLEALSGKLQIENVHSIEQTNYPLCLVSAPGEKLPLKIAFDQRYFGAEEVQRMLGHLQTLLQSFADHPNAPLLELPMLTPDEQQQLLVAWNNTAASLSFDPVHYTIERIAQRFPDHTALRFNTPLAGQLSLSYAQLNQRANQLAHYLRSLGAAPDTLVAICLERSFEMIIAALAVLKAGAAFLPLDPANPPERNTFTLLDSQAPILLTTSPIAHALGLPAPRRSSAPSPAPAHILCLEHAWEAEPSLQPASSTATAAQPAAPDLLSLADQPTDNPSHLTSPEHLAYVIYTSGSTGQPKGVLIPHRGLSNVVQAYIRDMHIHPGTRILQIFSFCFDGSLIEIFPCLCAGGVLVLAEAQTLKSAVDIHSLLQHEAIQVIIAPPSLLAVLPDYGLPELHTVVSGGERCTQEIARRWANRVDAPGSRFFNAYGPTEISIASHWYQATDLDALQRSLPPDLHEEIPIGQPIDNMQAFVLDSHLRPLPSGIPGELCITGVGVARGYLNRPELTQQRFIPNTLSIRQSSDRTSPAAQFPLMYRTGDIVRRLPDGNFVYQGRVDHQVKLRGYRIELGEIESALNALPGVSQSVVLLRGIAGETAQSGGESALASPVSPHLVAYINPMPGHQISASELRSALQKKLPEYMIPTFYVPVDSFPYTPSGKIDRKLLATMPLSPGSGWVAKSRDYAPPANPLEQSLVKIWEEILDFRPVGVRDNFFELGGHSLLAVRLIGRIEQELHAELPLLTIFKHPTIRELADQLRCQDGQVPLSLLVPLQPDGHRNPLFFVHPSGGSVHWYLELSRLLGEDQPFYGIQAQGLNSQTPPHDSIESMAAHYVRAIRSFQPQGPYFLGSWSMGVVIAYEMACQLDEAGEQIGLLALLDQGPRIPLAEPEDQADYLVQTFGKQIELSLAALRQLEPDQQIRSVWQAGRESGFILPDITLEQFHNWVTIMTTHTQAWRRYQPRPYAGRVTLFRAVDEPRMQDLPVDMGWGNLARGGVEIVDVPGDHLTMIHAPHVSKLAEALRLRLGATPLPA